MFLGSHCLSEIPANPVLPERGGGAFASKIRKIRLLSAYRLTVNSAFTVIVKIYK